MTTIKERVTFKKDSKQYKKALSSIKYLLKNKKSLYSSIETFALSVKSYMDLRGEITEKQYNSIVNLETRCHRFLQPSRWAYGFDYELEDDSNYFEISEWDLF